MTSSELARAIRVVFDLRFKLHLPDIRNELGARCISRLGKVLVDAFAFDETNFRIEIAADVLVNGYETKL